MAARRSQNRALGGRDDRRDARVAFDWSELDELVCFGGYTEFAAPDSLMGDHGDEVGGVEGRHRRRQRGRLEQCFDLKSFIVSEDRRTPLAGGSHGRERKNVSLDRLLRRYISQRQITSAAGL